MHSANITILNEISRFTEESFLIEHSYNRGMLKIILEKDKEHIEFLIVSPINYFGEISDCKIGNIGSISFEKLTSFLDVNRNGYYCMREGEEEIYKVFRNKSKIALGHKEKDYNYMGFFKGSIIQNAFLVGSKNIDSIKLLKEHVMCL